MSSREKALLSLLYFTYLPGHHSFLISFCFWMEEKKKPQPQLPNYFEITTYSRSFRIFFSISPYMFLFVSYFFFLGGGVFGICHFLFIPFTLFLWGEGDRRTICLCIMMYALTYSFFLWSLLLHVKIKKGKNWKQGPENYWSLQEEEKKKPKREGHRGRKEYLVCYLGEIYSSSLPPLQKKEKWSKTKQKTKPCRNKGFQPYDTWLRTLLDSQWEPIKTCKPFWIGKLTFLLEYSINSNGL